MSVILTLNSKYVKIADVTKGIYNPHGAVARQTARIGASVPVSRCRR